MKKEHPLVCYDGMNGDLVKIQLCDGTQYSCTGVVDFLQPVLDEYQNDYPEIRILLRGESGFAAPDLYKQCEENGTSPAVYSEFMYQAGSWPYERRAASRVEKLENQMVYMYTFIVTNMDSLPEYLFRFYCKRGRLALSADMRKQRIDTVRLKLLKIAAEAVRSAGYITEGCIKDYSTELEKKYALTFDEEKEFLECIRNRSRMKRYCPVYEILLKTGLRISEAIGLTWTMLIWIRKRLALIIRYNAGLWNVSIHFMRIVQKQRLVQE